MALKLPTVTKYGVTAEHWRITQSNIDWVNKRALISLLLYVNKAAYQAGSDPVGSITIEVETTAAIAVPIDGVDQLKDIRTMLYDLAKQSPAMSDAFDEAD